jgi:7,8-dihydropterin-6-yl-methyl-4-(beta-D-ribofuranosyl)aminobenzene 5'-phosphate synthase
MLSSRLRGEHGISFLIEQGNKSVLFDTGQSFETLSHNANILGKDLRSVEAILLSHGHYDHTGGVIGVCRESRAPLYAHPAAFEKKYKLAKGMDPAYIGIPYSREEIETLSAIHLSAEPAKILPGVTLTGEIPRITPSEAVPEVFQKFVAGSFIKDDIADDQSIIVDNGEEAHIILGCNHAGLMNTIERCKELTSSPITMVYGGTHLVAATPQRMAETVTYLNDNEITLHGYHCTGDRASFELRQALRLPYEKGYVGMGYLL